MKDYFYLNTLYQTLSFLETYHKAQYLRALDPLKLYDRDVLFPAVALNFLADDDSIQDKVVFVKFLSENVDSENEFVDLVEIISDNLHHLLISFASHDLFPVLRVSDTKDEIFVNCELSSGEMVQVGNVNRVKSNTGAVMMGNIIVEPSFSRIHEDLTLQLSKIKNVYH